MSDEKRSPRPATQYGPTAATVAVNVKRLRDARRLTIYALSGALGEAGRPITPSAVAKIEKQQRQVTVDDLAALAVVFNVSPAALLLPMAEDEEIEVTGGGTVRAATAWAWANSQRPLGLTPGREETDLLEYQLYSLPQRVRSVRQHPAGRALDAVQHDVTRLVSSARIIAEGSSRFDEDLDAARVSLDRLTAEVNRVGTDYASQVRDLAAWKADVLESGKKKGATDGPSVD
ncbi:helix-turn-helix transcriptional regulator [Streptomyces sp. S584]|uniref:helix-turn-helix domain-containing protein n=1 Tax=Streptomyces sp. S584 TaxID=3096010 RepID=UPI002AFDFB87|nr:helix-turn-helix transcriptional regulator [Streptomyces sp. S584]